MNEIDGLLPIRLVSTAMPNDKYDNRIDIVNTLVAYNGKEIMCTSNGRWAKYIMESANAKGTTERFVMTRSEPSEIICCFDIPEIPVSRTDTNIIKKNRDGTYVIGTDKEYSDRSRFILGEKSNIVLGKERLIPFDCSINTEFIFYIMARNKDVPVVSSLVDAGLDELIKLGIIHGKSIRHISGTNGSRVKQIPKNEKEHTQVIVRRVADGH